MLKHGVEEVTGGDHRVHEGFRERLLHRTRRQVIDDSHIPGGFFTIFARQQIAADHVDAWRVTSTYNRLESTEIAKLSRQAPNLENPVVQEARYDSGAQESRWSRDEHWLAEVDDHFSWAQRRPFLDINGRT